MLVGAIESLSRTTKAIIAKEREAYGLNEDAAKGGGETAPPERHRARHAA